MDTAKNENAGMLAGQRALVTGANSGIGEAVAKALAAAGASVAVNYVANEGDAYQVVSDIESAGGKAMAVQADVGREDQVKAMFRKMIAAYGSIDILVNNAGLQRDAAFPDMTLEQWNFVLSVNLTGQFLCAREAAREFIRRGVVPELSSAAGKIVCMSSVHQAIPWSRHANYAASKGGVMMLMQTMAQELAAYHIRVNSIAPGAIKTPINKSAWQTPEAEQKLRQLIPYDRVGSTADIARAVVWLVSDQADYITGTTLFVDGGMMLYPGFRTGG
jgi:glucose 1-dehydrogenase